MIAGAFLKLKDKGGLYRRDITFAYKNGDALCYNSIKNYLTER